MKLIFKKIIVVLTILLFFPIISHAENNSQDKVFSAEITKILQEQDVVQTDGKSIKQQNLEFKGLDGDYKDKIITYNKIGSTETLNKNIYKVGDKVSVQANFDDSGNVQYFISDYIRTGSIKWVAIIFVLVLLLVGGKVGFRSLISLVVSALVIMKYILPQIMDGADPVVVTIIGSFAVLLAVIYITEGINISSHIAVVSIFCSLVVTVILSVIFVNMAKLSGTSTEEAGFLVSFGRQAINFKGLLLAGIIIGTLGVLDDVVISQIASVNEIYKANPGQTKMQLFKSAYKIGVAHISSMTNTLFLAYAGASLPLLILFLSGQSAFANASQALNNESLATEVIRTLTGSIGLILAVPISTTLAVLWFKRK